MKVFGLVLILISLNSYAAKYYEIGMDLSIDGKKIATPRIFTKNNMTETVIQGDKFFEITVKENPINQTVKMDLTVGEFDENRNRINISKLPTFIGKENKRMHMTKIREDGTEELNMSIVPLVKEI